ncbi:MAG TPA: hypothetical protein VGI81_16285 [Tepidisphaeraceae bacterium]|jgi:hypothetical protein
MAARSRTSITPAVPLYLRWLLTLVPVAAVAGGIPHCRYLCRRLRRKFPDLPIVVGYFGKAREFDKLLIKLRAAGASYVNTSIAQVRAQVLSMLPAAAAQAEAPAPVPEPTPSPILRAVVS